MCFTSTAAVAGTLDLHRAPGGRKVNKRWCVSGRVPLNNAKANDSRAFFGIRLVSRISQDHMSLSRLTEPQWECVRVISGAVLALYGEGQIDSLVMAPELFISNLSERW